MTSPAWPDTGPDADPSAPPTGDGWPGAAVARRLGPVGIAAIVAAVLVLFGIAAVALPLAFSGSTDHSRTPAGAAPAPAGGPNGVTDATPSDTAAPATPTGVPTPTRSATPLPTVAGNARFEDQVVALVNAERARARCQPVREDERLRAAARAHSTDMAAMNFVNHTGSDGSSPADRMQRAGYGQGLSENIARGPQRPEDVMRAWMRSRDNRANIVNCDANAIGVGLAYRGRTPYWTQNFGRA